uniref:C2H2-type domain-containing protein n=1 Tax=Esox lucius TaxID=8010 RepID=A0A3P8YVE9_ESOLU
MESNMSVLDVRSGCQGEEKPYSDHISAPSASLTYHLNGYQHPQWNQDTRDIRNSLSSQTASPKAWSPAMGLYSGPEDPGEGGGNQATLDMDRLAPSLPNPSSLHRAYGPPAGREDHVDPPGLHRSIQSFINGLTTSVLKGGRKRRAAGARVSSGRGEPGSAEGEERVGAGGSGRGGEGESVATHSTNRSQYEPLDLSRRPDWLVSSQAASAHNNRPLGEVTGLLQPHSPGSNGSPSSSTNRLQAPTGQHLAQSDWSELGSGTGGDLATPTELEDPRSYDSSAPDPDGAPDNPVSDSTEGHERPNKRRRRKHCSEEVAQRRADCLQGCPEETQEQWSRSVIRTLLSPAPLRRPRQTSRQQPPRDLLSVLQSSVRHNQMLLNGPAASFNGGGLKEGAEILGGKPFQCKYCPYSATQKGNLKTHVLCVHRRPFDSSLYPDRRLRRPHANPVLTQQGSTGSSYFPKSMGLEKAARSTHSGRDLIMTSTCGT